MSGFWLVCVTLYTTYNGTRKILKECMSRSVELFIWFQYQLEMVEWVIQSSFFNFTYTKRERKKYKRLRKNLWPFFILKDEIGKTLPDWKVMPTCLFGRGMSLYRRHTGQLGSPAWAYVFKSKSCFLTYSMNSTSDVGSWQWGSFFW